MSSLRNLRKKAQQERDTYKVSLETLQYKQSEVNTKIKGIEERIGGCDDKTCPICAMKVSKPGLTPCCNNVFCMSCIGMSLNVSKECPLCRAILDIQKVSLIVKSNITETKKSEDQLPTKLDTLINYLKTNSDRKIMVFSEFSNTFSTIRTNLEKEGIGFSQLIGSSDRITKIIRRYEAGEFQVLLLNARAFGAGLNLQITDDIFIYHRMNKDLETQVIGRAQRMGRKEPLNIQYLCYENEYPTDE